MPFKIVHNDIAEMNTDAIVNAANSHLQMGGGVCGAIFKKAGVELLKKELDEIGICPVGQAVITKGYNLPAKYIIHAVGPVWKGGLNNEKELLASAYRSSLKLAKEYNLESISFPLLSAGAYGYPKEEALQIAIGVISDFLMKNEMDIYLVVFDRSAVSISEKLFGDMIHYINTYYEPSYRIRKSIEFEEIYSLEEPFIHEFKTDLSSTMKTTMTKSLEDALNNLDETFSEMLLRLIDEKGKTDVEVYKKANIDRRLFSKIRNNKNYCPKKSTALALAISLELSLDETIDLLSKAGYTLSPSNKFDVIIQYFIEKEIYDIYTINETLFYFDQSLLGA